MMHNRDVTKVKSKKIHTYSNRKSFGGLKTQRLANNA